MEIQTALYGYIFAGTLSLISTKCQRNSAFDGLCHSKSRSLDNTRYNTKLKFANIYPLKPPHLKFGQEYASDFLYQ